MYRQIVAGRRLAFPAHFFHGAEGLRRLRWIVEAVFCDQIGIEVDALPRALTRKMLAEWRLAGVLTSRYRNSPRVLLDALYPGRFHPWEFPRVPAHCWDGPAGRQRAREATRWLVDRHLGGEIRRLHGGLWRLFERHRLEGMLTSVYGGSVTAAIVDAFPGMPPWLAHCPPAYWVGPVGHDRAAAAVRWLIEDRLHLGPEDVPRRLTFRLFKQNGLGPMVSACFGGSPSRAVEAAYPGRYEPWEFRCAPMGYWSGPNGREHAREATRWLGRRLAGDRRSPRRTDFRRGRLETMLKIVYGGSPSAALRDAGLLPPVDAG